MHVDVALRGAVPRELAQVAAERISQLEHVTTGPLLHARVVLTPLTRRASDHLPLVVDFHLEPARRSRHH